MANLVIFARLPELGRGKTRLARELGTLAAMRIQRQMLRLLLRELGTAPQWKTHLAFEPNRAYSHALALAGSISIRAQGEGGMTARLARLFQVLPSPLVIIGSDCPYVRRHHIAAAFRVLAYRDAVLGPAEDGGFWLIGLRHPARAARALAKVRWSTSHACRDMAAGLAPARIGFLQTLPDIDEAEHYRQWQADA